MLDKPKLRSELESAEFLLASKLEVIMNATKFKLGPIWPAAFFRRLNKASTSPPSHIHLQLHSPSLLRPSCATT